MAAFRTATGEYLPTPTARELQCIEYIAQGMVYKEVARELGIADRTVRSHLAGLYRRLDASNATHAYRLCLEKGYIQLS